MLKTDKQDQINSILTRQEFQEGMTELRNELVTKIDGFVQLYSKMDQEQHALRALYFRHEKQIGKIGKRLNIALD